MRVDAIEFVPERRTWQAPPGHIDSEAGELASGKHTKSDMENGPVEIVDLPIYPIKSADVP
jgi:hypothetical protein